MSTERMQLSFYTIDDLSREGWRLQEHETLKAALDCYRALPATGHKVLGMSDGGRTLDLVYCLPIYEGDESGEDVRATDYRQMEYWRDAPEAARITRECIAALKLRYGLDGHVLSPLPSEDKLPDDLADKHLWLDVDLRRMSAIHLVLVAKKGWVKPDILNGPKDPEEEKKPRPLVLKYRANCFNAHGNYFSMVMEPWEYKLLLRKTLERLEDTERGGTDHV